MVNITPRSLKLFLEFAADARNCGGAPMVGANVGGSREDSGTLTHLKKAGLITTSDGDGVVYVHFTESGRARAAQHGIDIPI